MKISKKTIKKTAFKPVKAVIDRIDFVKILQKLDRTEAAGQWRERLGPPQPAFADQEDIIKRTIELTEADLSERNEKTVSSEIENFARIISCRYDFDLHDLLSRSVTLALEHLFENEDPDRLFLSEDRRELAHLEGLRQARRDGLGVVYLINHSSHLDEFITGIVLNQLKLGLPLFAAGTNMMATPSLERLLMIGSYVIVRRGAGKTYLSTLFNYCRALSEMGKQQGIFLEAWSGGARTRDGSLRYPRRLVTLQGALASAKDVLVQPICLSYGVVPEDLSLSERAGALSWLNGLPYFKHWLRSPHRPVQAFSRSLKGLYGRAFITFCRPKFLSELETGRADDPSHPTRDEFAALFAIKEIARDKKIMTSHLTARALVRAGKLGTTDLEAAAGTEMDQIIEYHRRTFGQDPDFEDFIRRNNLSLVIKDGLERLRRRKIIGRGRPLGRLPQVLAKHGLLYYATHADRRLYSPSAQQNIVVVGAGAGGYALACLVGLRTLEDKQYANSSVTLFDSREDLVEDIVDTRFHPVHFPEIRLPKTVFCSHDPTAAFRKASEVLIAVPVHLFEVEFRRVLAEIQQPVQIIIATRGFERNGRRLPIQIAWSVIEETGRNDVSIFVLSGPVTPEILAYGRGGSLVLAGPLPAAHQLADLFKLPGFQVYVCDDPVGVQVAGTMTQVYSVLGAYLLRTKALSGRQSVAAFFRETSEEATKLAQVLGGKKETFLAANPAWGAEYVAEGLGGPGAKFGRQAGGLFGRTMRPLRHSPPELVADLHNNGYRHIGFHGIKSAYLAAQALRLNLPRLEEAYEIFWRQ